MRNWFAELNSVNVSDHIEKKNGLSYLSWSYAWTELKKRFPLSRATVYETDDHALVWKDPVGAHVKTGVTIVWEEEDGLHEHEAIEYLPIMNMRNQAVAVDAIDAMMVNKTIQRSLTKCIARLGMGMYIYAGEDLPEESEDEKAAKAKVADLIKQIDAKVMPKVKNMDAAGKNAFADRIKDIVGVPNYKTVTDVSKLEALLKSLS